MRRVPLLSIATVVCVLGTTLLWVSPASAAGTITVTPTSDLMQQQSVHVDGAGFPGSVTVGVCEGIKSASPGQGDCATNVIPVLVTSAPGGTFSVDVGVARKINVPSLGRTIDCTIESCYVAAAVFNDIAGTVVYQPITFDAGLADGRIKRRSDGAITGDNVYGFGPGEVRTHSIAPGGYWTYALQVQNDGPTTANLTVGASTFSDGGFPPTAQFFSSYFDITSLVLGSGFTFTNVAPGEVITFALRFHVPDTAPIGSNVNAFVGFGSGNAGQTDALSLYVRVQAPT